MCIRDSMTTAVNEFNNGTIDMIDLDGENAKTLKKDGKNVQAFDDGGVWYLEFNSQAKNLGLNNAKAVSYTHLWAYRMREKYAYSTVKNMKRSLNATFHLAIQDDLLRKNPFDFALTDVIENDTKKKEALTKEEIKALLDFAKTDKTYKVYYPAIVILLNTGCLLYTSRCV